VEEFKNEVGVEVEVEDKITLKQKDIPVEGVLRVIDLKIAK